MLDVTSRAAVVLKDKLVRSCYEAGIGFRMVVGRDESGRKTIVLRPDKEQEGDPILEAPGVRLLIDRATAARVSPGQLDLQEDTATTRLVYR